MYSKIVIFISIVNSIATAPVVTVVSKTQNNQLSNSIGKPSESTTSATTNKERNWLLTKAWLIDNINRLRHEFNELERDYSHHIDTSNTVNTNKDKQLVQDIATLRADHTVLSQQQKQIIQLIKKSQMKSIATYRTNQISTETTTESTNSLKKKHKRHSNYKEFVKKEQSFEEQTKRNMSEVFAEMSALHDITINIFEDLVNIEKKVNDSIERS